MDGTITVRNVQELDEMEQKIVQAARGLVLELSIMCTRCREKWDNASELDNLLVFLKDLQDGEIAYDPLGGSEKIQVGQQVSLTFDYMAAIGALRWLFQNHPEIAAYRLSFESDGDVRIMSLDETNGVAAQVLSCCDHERTLETKRTAKLVGELSGAASLNSRYIFVLSESATNGEFEREREYGDVSVLVRGLGFPSSTPCSTS